VVFPIGAPSTRISGAPGYSQSISIPSMPSAFANVARLVAKRLRLVIMADRMILYVAASVDAAHPPKETIFLTFLSALNSAHCPFLLSLITGFQVAESISPKAQWMLFK